MKPRILFIFLFFNFTTSLFSQETTKPLTHTEIMRNVTRIDIEGKEYENVKVTLKSVSPDYYFSDKYWPDFDAQELKKAIESYARRERRYGTA